MSCCSLIILVLQELKGKGQEPVCGALVLRCAVLVVWNRHLGQTPHLPLKHTKSPLPATPKYPNTPQAGIIFQIEKREACGSILAADSGVL